MLKQYKRLITIFAFLLLVAPFVLKPTVSYAENNQDEDNNSPTIMPKENDDQEDDNRRNKWQEKLEDRKDKLEDRIDTLKENREKRVVGRCTMRRERLDTRIKMFEVTQRFHKDKYERLVTRIEALLARVKEQGVNTDKASADLATLKTKVADVKTKYQALMDKLKALENEPCPTTGEDTNFATQLTEVKTLLDNLRAAVKDAKDYFVNTIRPDLQDIKKQLMEKKQETKTEENESSEESSN